MYRMLEDAGPFGQAAPAPRFAFSDQLIDSAATMGDRHLRLQFRSPGSPRWRPWPGARWTARLVPA